MIPELYYRGIVGNVFLKFAVLLWMPRWHETFTQNWNAFRRVQQTSERHCLLSHASEAEGAENCFEVYQKPIQSLCHKGSHAVPDERLEACTCWWNDRSFIAGPEPVLTYPRQTCTCWIAIKPALWIEVLAGYAEVTNLQWCAGFTSRQRRLEKGLRQVVSSSCSLPNACTSPTSLLMTLNIWCLHSPSYTMSAGHNQRRSPEGLVNKVSLFISCCACWSGLSRTTAPRSETTVPIDFHHSSQI